MEEGEEGKEEPLLEPIRLGQLQGSAARVFGNIVQEPGLGAK